MLFSYSPGFSQSCKAPEDMGTLIQCRITEIPMLTDDGVDRDHYRYFSQLIIAFKIMAVDMVALLVLILISCSGFFVAFTSFARHSYSAREIG